MNKLVLFKNKENSHETANKCDVQRHLMTSRKYGVDFATSGIVRTPVEYAEYSKNSDAKSVTELPFPVLIMSHLRRASGVSTRSIEKCL